MTQHQLKLCWNCVNKHLATLCTEGHPELTHRVRHALEYLSPELLAIEEFYQARARDWLASPSASLSELGFVLPQTVGARLELVFYFSAIRLNCYELIKDQVWMKKKFLNGRTYSWK